MALEDDVVGLAVAGWVAGVAQALENLVELDGADGDGFFLDWSTLEERC